MCGLAGRGIMVPCFPQIKMSQNLFNNTRLFYKRDHSHLTVAPRTNQRIDIVDLLDKPGPILSKHLPGNIRVYESRDLVVS